LVKERFYRIILIKKFNFSLIIIFFFLFFVNNLEANFKENFLNKYKTVNTLSFNFTQKIGKKVEFGKCYIKYPLLMRCEYPKKKKSIITNGKKIAIIKRRYNKIYYYPLKKTPLFYLLEKKNFLNLIQNYEPTKIDSNIIEYNVLDNNLNELKIFIDKNSSELLGWRTLDAYSNEVNFIIRNIEKNIPIKNEFFNIPNKEDL